MPCRPTSRTRRLRLFPQNPDNLLGRDGSDVPEPRELVAGETTVWELRFFLGAQLPTRRLAEGRDVVRAPAADEVWALTAAAEGEDLRVEQSRLADQSGGQLGLRAFVLSFESSLTRSRPTGWCRR